VSDIIYIMQKLKSQLLEINILRKNKRSNQY